ncbi:hypothetical protein DD374_005562 [Escherichia coli]|nr:hypothetical protein [Escherichia coli]
MNILKKLMQRLCGCGKHDDRENGELLTAQLRLGPADILESYSAAIFLIPICISFDTAEKRRYATYLILNRRFSFEF